MGGREETRSGGDLAKEDGKSSGIWPGLDLAAKTSSVNVAWSPV